LDERLEGVHEFAPSFYTNLGSPPEVLYWFAKAVLKSVREPGDVELHLAAWKKLKLNASGSGSGKTHPMIFTTKT
jgi:hypothetical protein